MREFREGFLASMPLWLGVMPFGLVFAALARSAGLSFWETQAMSLVLYAGSAQFASIGLIGAGADPLALILSAALINLRHVLYGFSLERRVAERGWRRYLMAFFLTDETYGTAMQALRRGPRSWVFVLGAGFALYLAWNASTLAGQWVGGLVDPASSGLELVFPLTFVAFTAPYLRKRGGRVVALVAFLAALLLIPLLSGGLGLLLAMALGVAWGLRPKSTLGVQEASGEV